MKKTLKVSRRDARRAARAAAAPRLIWIAAVVKMSGKDLVQSSRQYGDWAAFISEDRNEAIEQARAAQVSWEKNGCYGPYTIVVGRLTERVVFPMMYALVLSVMH